mmetsp:Transcript_102868/g.265903  ORF Transcript_102868/g.265903 Transcript_102868/m.265903 type:complete len:297 (+) Transcript_102868:399-1289(+)
MQPGLTTVMLDNTGQVCPCPPGHVPTRTNYQGHHLKHLKRSTVICRASMRIPARAMCMQSSAHALAKGRVFMPQRSSLEQNMFQLQAAIVCTSDAARSGTFKSKTCATGNAACRRCCTSSDHCTVSMTFSVTSPGHLLMNMCITRSISSCSPVAATRSARRSAATSSGDASSERCLSTRLVVLTILSMVILSRVVAPKDRSPAKLDTRLGVTRSGRCATSKAPTVASSHWHVCSRSALRMASVTCWTSAGLRPRLPGSIASMACRAPCSGLLVWQLLGASMLSPSIALSSLFSSHA